MHFAVVLLVVTAVYCQVPGWKPWWGVGPIYIGCSLQGSTLSCPWWHTLKGTSNSPTGESSSTPASASTPSMIASPKVFKR
ncbi:hypothetical protein V3C99_009110 [Haemonchus contortus]|uniref:Secreted protein n=1 Tax=Haemonchus contortus TaxID=6289 RepID=A0A7I4YM68_HAECO|nr:unnamed protein product [Haemonchus contortus]